MSVPVIIFMSIYLLVLCCYFYTETTNNLKLRAPNKILLAVMFFTFALVEFIIQDKYSFKSFHIIFVIALLLAALGDILLLWSFSKGGAFFLSGNICFVVYEILLLEDNGILVRTYWWIFVVIGVLSLVYILLLSLKVIDAGKYKLPYIFYMISITFHGITGLALVCYLPSTYLLLGIGSILFMISDVLLMLDKFVFNDNKWVLRANSAFYFVGILLMVLSMVI